MTNFKMKSVAQFGNLSATKQVAYLKEEEAFLAASIPAIDTVGIEIFNTFFLASRWDVDNKLTDSKSLLTRKKLSCERDAFLLFQAERDVKLFDKSEREVVLVGFDKKKNSNYLEYQGGFLKKFLDLYDNDDTYIDTSTGKYSVYKEEGLQGLAWWSNMVAQGYFIR